MGCKCFHSRVLTAANPHTHFSQGVYFSHSAQASQSLLPITPASDASSSEEKDAVPMHWKCSKLKKVLDKDAKICVLGKISLHLRGSMMWGKNTCLLLSQTDLGSNSTGLIVE